MEPTSTTDEVLEGVNLSGKRVLVTGVSAGLGVETARALAAHGAEVVGAARDLAKAKAATASVRADAANGGSLELVELDLASLASVRACADALVADGKPFDLVIANAGVMATPFGKTADGFETQFGTNHLGHFVLVNRIASLMKPGARLVNLSSAGHRFPTSISTIRISSARPTARGRPTAVRRPPTSCSPSSSTAATRSAASAPTAVHPGGIQTELGRYLDDEARRRADRNHDAGRAACRARSRLPARSSRRARRPRSGRRRSRRPTRSAAAIARIATSPRSSTRPASRSRGVRPYALDPERAKALWAKSEEMVGERFA